MTKRTKHTTDRRRVGQFYFSLNYGPDRQPLVLADGQVVWVRIVEGLYMLEEALDDCYPDSDEELMNTHVLPRVRRKH